MSAFRNALDRATRIIDAECEPLRMTKQEAVEFNELVIEHCRAAIDALRDEMEE